MIVCRLRVGTQENDEFEEHDSYDLEAYESVNAVLMNHHDDDACNHAVLELIFPMGEVTLATFKKARTKTKKGVVKARWRLV